MVRKFGTNKNQVLHRLRLRLFRPRQPIPDVPTTSQEWKPELEVIVKHDDLYARAWESEYETPIFDNGQHEPDIDNSLEISVRHDLPNDETRTIPGIIPENSPQVVPHTDEIGDETDTDHYTEPDAEANVEPLSPTDINPRSTKYDANLSWYGTRNNYVHHMCIFEKCYGTLTEHLRTYTQKLLVSLLKQHCIANHSVLVISQNEKFKPRVPEISTQCILVCPTEHFRRLSRKIPKFWLRMYP